MKTAVVTGSSRGIGKAIAEELCKKGYFVVLNAAKSEEELAETHREFKEKGYSCAAVLADVSDYEAAKKLFYFNADVLVNNAGVSHIGLFMDMQPDEWKRVVDINLNSVMNCTHIVLPYMLRQHSGVIINISSMWGEKGASCEAVYSATKGGIITFTKALAKELAYSNVTVNAISPGVVDTDMINHLSLDEKQELINEIPLGRLATTEDISNCALFLASDKANYITGQNIQVDGGFAN